MGVFKQNVANQKSMSLLNEVAVPLEQSRMALSYVSKGLFRNIPVKACKDRVSVFTARVLS